MTRMLKKQSAKKCEYEYTFLVAPQNCKLNKSDLKEFWYCYKNNIRGKYARGLLTFAFGQFKSTYWHENLNELDEKVKKVDENYGRSNLQELYDFQFNYIPDSIKICLSFENYFKYKLLQKGYSIHEIGLNSNYKANDLDISKPVEIKKLLELNGFNEIDIQQKIPKMKRKTYSLSTMLNNNNDFNEIARIPGIFLPFLRDLNETRNNLHNLFELTGKISLKRIDIIRRMDKFLQSEIDDEMNYNEYLIT